jgi:hypothetical protein
MKSRWLIVLMLAMGSRGELAAAEHYGQVTFGGLPVPGATVSASQGDKQLVTITDRQGVYKLPDLADGTWTIRVEMLGFSAASQDVTVTAGSQPSIWELKLTPFEEIAKLAAPGFQRAAAIAIPANAANPANPANLANLANPANPANPENPGGDADLAQRAADGFLVNGSVNNGAASPFAQLAQFGNNRRGLRSLYNGGLGAIVGNSAFDARAFSFTNNQSTSKSDYSDLQFAGTIGGPLRIPRVLRNGPNVFALYQRTSDHSANTQPALMPTALERTGDFSHTRDAQGRAIHIIDPATGLPFAGGVIPQDRISPQAAALLGYFPLPNLDAPGRYNYQQPILTATRQDSVQTRLTQPGFGRNQLFGTFAYQRTRTDAASVFGFEDSTRVSGLDAAINWSHRFSQFFTLRTRYQLNRLTTEVMPFFANRTNVSGNAFIDGNNQDPVNWGPPRLTFSSGVEPLVDAQYSLNHSQTHAGNGEVLWAHGRHSITFGGDVRWQQLTLQAQQDARGAFTFNGSATGSDLADFLLGIPHASSIAFGNADKYFHAPSYDGYFTDDVRFGPGLTLNAGIRWEYEAPITERFGRLVNLDVAPGFASVSPVVANNPVGPLTGRQYADSLISPDKRGFQPRVGVAWRPIAGSSLAIRAGYGIYRNTSVYQSIAMIMAQQSPLSNTLSVETSAANPLTLANGFIARPGSPGATSNTFAVDPDFRVGYAENWQASVQRDLPGSMTVLTTYLGTRGTHLMQEFLPNTYPSGAVNPCPACPAGFVYLTSTGRSTRHAGQLQVRRRLRNGLTATVQYTLSNAMDDAGAFTGVSLNGGAIAQDWQNLDAEWARSNFDQRHLVTAQFQYTTGVGVAGGALLTGVKGALFKGWTITSQLNAGSGLPLTPIVLTSVPGTAVTGTIRADLTDAPADAVPAGLYANPAAYTVPGTGRWGSAGRNSITGPAQFGLNAGLTRTFPWGNRLNLDWRIDATNILNRVTYSGVNTIVGSQQFGLPNRANTMRKVQTSLRLRF